MPGKFLSTGDAAYQPQTGMHSEGEVHALQQTLNTFRWDIQPSKLPLPPLDLNPHIHVINGSFSPH